MEVLDEVAKKIIEAYDNATQQNKPQYIGDGLYIDGNDRLYHKVEGTERFYEVVRIR